MSDDLFFEGEEPTEEIKKDKPKAKPAPSKGKAPQGKGGKGRPPQGKGGGNRPPGKGGPQGKRPAPAAAKSAGFEFTPTVVVLVAIITLLIGFLLGLFAANWLLPDVNTSPPQQVAPQQGGGGMGQMGGGMGGEEAPILTDDQMMEGQMPAGHPQIEYDAEGNPIMPEGMTEGGAGTLNEDGTATIEDAPEETPADE